jgi:hypothetical protein
MRRRQEIIGPGNSRSQCPLPLRHVESAAREKLESPGEAGQESRWREHLQPCRRQFDGKGETIQPPAAFRNCPQVVLARGKHMIDRARPL